VKEGSSVQQQEGVTSHRSRQSVNCIRLRLVAWPCTISPSNLLSLNRYFRCCFIHYLQSLAESFPHELSTPAICSTRFVVGGS
jgi:hypothetical protein